GDERIVLLLVARANEVRPTCLVQRDKDKRTAFAHAAANGHTAVLDALLVGLTAAWQAGQVNWFTALELEEPGKTAAQLAAAGGHKAAAELLTGYSQRMLNDVSPKLGRTALAHLSEMGDRRGVEALLERGAVQTVGEQTPLMLAA